MTQPDSDALRAAFEDAVPGYDALRRKLIPHFDAFYGTALDLLEEAVGGDAFRCVDLGVGTGLLSEMILERFPGAQVEGVDLAPKMLDAARERLAVFGARVRLSFADYATAPLAGSLDAVVSALSIHHLDHEAKRWLFRRIHDALRPGGVFINADQSLGATSEIEDAYQRRWEADVRRSGIDDEDFAAARKRAKLDRSATFADQIAWLKDAGFGYADIGWKRHRFTVFYARR
ncbi:class I SAM-dependent methyltransferase [Methylocystis sp. B8]|uniref:class I SAM-dependent methyltransferase n=1 Tax=Methylocystis sp. B8 TaxID=544938 RepID=UPI0010FEACD9|nr:class I SAM-dependent methyltransferase [Methylocystis sp. B8]TLG78929.1 class I SAM-dependent methyltransferase [Methylocystis sp. B8]